MDDEFESSNFFVYLVCLLLTPFLLVDYNAVLYYNLMLLSPPHLFSHIKCKTIAVPFAQSGISWLESVEYQLLLLISIKLLRKCSIFCKKLLLFLLFLLLLLFSGIPACFLTFDDLLGCKSF